MRVVGEEGPEEFGSTLAPLSAALSVDTDLGDASDGASDGADDDNVNSLSGCMFPATTTKSDF